MKILSLTDFIAVQAYKDYAGEELRDPSKWHMSGFGSCMRKRIYKRADIAGLPECPKSLKNFAFGDMIHSYIQSQVNKNSNPDFQIMFMELVLPVHNGKKMITDSVWADKISGHIDLIARVNGKVIAYELKSIHYLAMNRYMKSGMVLEDALANAYPHHHAQLSAYIHFYNKSVKPGDGLEIDEGRIVYICKSNMFMAEVPLQKWDVEAELEKLEAAWKQYNVDGTLPPKIPSDDSKYWQCSYCTHRSICRNMQACDCQYCSAIMANDPLFDLEKGK